MLCTLQIENYALIERLTIEFGPGLNVFTGETGSGKSIIVDALGLLLGERAEASAVRAGAAQASVTGLFLTAEGEELLLRREIASGRSRTFVDQQLSTLAGLRQRARPLGEIHSQNEALVSFTPAAQLALLDRFAGLDPAPVAAAFTVWQAAAEALAGFQAAERGRLQQLDLWRFQAQEIDAVRPTAGEDAALEAEHQLLAHAERIAAAATAAYAALYDNPEAAAAQLKAALRHVEAWAHWDPAVGSLAQRLDAARIELDDVAHDIRARAAHVEASPERLARVGDRLAAIDRLKRKYGPSLEEVLAHRARLAADLAAAEAVSLEQAQAAAEAAAAAYRKLAAALSQRRRAAAPKLSRALAAEVQDLAMTVQFEVVFDADQTWRAAGWDQVQFQVALNPGEPALPLAQAASGGELSRLLLALHLAVEQQATPQPQAARRTLVLDEIDAGIGGRAAEAVGRKLRQLGERHQVLCVTHLAQIACCASTHLQVEKHTAEAAAGPVRTRTEVASLEGDARAREIARMLAGRADDPTALRHAAELLAAGRAPARRDATPRRAARSRG